MSCGWYWDPPCEADDEYVLLGADATTGDETVLAHFRLEGEGDTGVVVDAVTGTPLHEITLAGFSGDDVAWAELPTWNAVGVLASDGSLTIVEPPWPSFGVAPPVIAAVQGRFLAFVDTGPPSRSAALDAIEVWESANGAEWTSRGAADFGIEPSGETHVELDVSDRDGYLIARIEYDLEQIAPSAIELRSSDGFTWEPARTNAPGSDVEEVRDGFIVLGDRLWMSADGFTWEPLSILERPLATAFVVGDTLVVAYEPDGPFDTFDTWAFDLES